MSSPAFDEAFKALIGHEGGYVNDIRDPGGETKFGISKRAHPKEDIRNMSLERAKAIYLADYWIPAGCDRLPPDIAFDLFDAAVNSGVRQAVMMLQEAVGAAQDGVVGPVTIAKAKAFDPYALRCTFNAIRLRFMTNTRVWQTFGRGWARRIANNLARV
jgi:lysozyme family protein